MLDDLGTTVLDTVYGRVDPHLRVASVVIVDPLDPPTIQPDAIMLGIGVTDSNEVLDLIRILGKHRGVGLVLRAPVDCDAAVSRAVAESGVVILSLVRGVAWNRVASVLGNALGALPSNVAAERRARQIDVAGVGGLSGVADAISALLDAPVTIEDLNSRVVAFSSDQDRGDQARKSSVLAQQVPNFYTEPQRAQGVFERVYASEKPVFFSMEGISELPRVVMRVSADDEILGSIWAVVSEPLSPERERNFIEAAELVALYLLRGRVDMDAQRRSRQALLASLLAGGEQARSIAHQLRIDAGSLCVIAVDLQPPDGDFPAHPADAAARLGRVANSLALQLVAAHPGSIAGIFGDSAYAVLPLRLDLETPSRFVSQVGQEFHDRSKRHDPVLVAIGSVVDDAANLSASRRDADRAMRVIRSPKTSLGRSVARFDEVEIDTVLFEIHDRLVREQSAMTGPVPYLLAFDRMNDTDYAQTLDAFLASFGDIGQTAARLHVHPNTCRYRLRRITEISGLDLNDPDARFNAMLQLRVFRLQ